MVLYTKSIFLPVDRNDSLRISVMSRHTLNDGKTLDERIIPGFTYHRWYNSLAPPDALVGAYYKRNMPWDEFAQKYLEFLHTDAPKPYISLLAKGALREDITILCAELKPDNCHRRLLAEECKRLDNRVEIIHK